MKDIKVIVDMLREGIPAGAMPFDEMALIAGMEPDDLMALLKYWERSGFLRRLAANIVPAAVGLRAAALVVWDVDESYVEMTGNAFADMSQVSHCVEREPADDMMYNLYTMVHETCVEALAETVEEMSKAGGVKGYAVFPTVAEYKKTSPDVREDMLAGRVPMRISREIHERAQRVIPGGVNSPVRSFNAVGGDPPYIKKGCGATISDVDGRNYIDLVCSWGPLLLGHAHEEVIEAVKAAASDGLTFGAPTERECLLAEKITTLMPVIEKVRLVNSGTEATMSAVRLARAATGRDAIVKFEGCYHGHADSFLIRAGSGAATLGVPSSPGVPSALATKTYIATYNDIDSVRELFDTDPQGIACVIVEPVAANMGVVMPRNGFLQSVRELADRHGALLIFDEVITGFRLAAGGAAEYFGVTPDLVTLGKIIGGGMPVGAYGGKRELMDMMAPAGPVYQAGTLSGNPIATAAGLATLDVIVRDNPYRRLEAMTAKLFAGLSAVAESCSIPTVAAHTASLGTVFFTSAATVDNWAAASSADTGMYARFHKSMLAQGVYIAPSQFEAMFLSTAHTENDVDTIIECAAVALKYCAG